MEYRTEFVSSIKHIPASQWHNLSAGAGPFLQYAFLAALEECECVGKETGWKPHFLVVYQHDELIAAIPGYLKYDSYGEYVFDHSWANAYHQHGMRYYPKWIAAIPFTPVTGPRLLTKGVTAELQSAINTALDGLGETGLSSLHWLFCDAATEQVLTKSNYLARYSVQFQWHNYQYSQFSDFTDALTSRKRRDLRKSRRRLADAGVNIQRYSGSGITPELMTFFCRCYEQTYLKRSGHSGYLTPAFFQQLLSTMGDNLMLVVASMDDSAIASALFFFDQTGLYGRYWGAFENIDSLHFECCYFQGIEFAIERGLPLFNPGTQGEHKILRGFEPVFCVSMHKLFAPAFHSAVANFLHQETPAIKRYFNQASDVLPFNQSFLPQLKSTQVSDLMSDTQPSQSNYNEI